MTAKHPNPWAAGDHTPAIDTAAIDALLARTPFIDEPAPPIDAAGRRDIEGVLQQCLKRLEMLAAQAAVQGNHKGAYGILQRLKWLQSSGSASRRPGGPRWEDEPMNSRLLYQHAMGGGIRQTQPLAVD